MAEKSEAPDEELNDLQEAFIANVNELMGRVKALDLPNNELRVGTAFWAGILGAKELGIGPKRVVELFMAILQGAGAAVEIHTLDLGPPSEAKN